MIISGDLTTFATEEEMNDAEDFIAKIAAVETWRERTAVPATAPRLLIIPGNHDLDWAKTGANDKHERFDRLSEAVRGDGSVLSSRYRRMVRDPWIDFGDQANLFVYLLNSTLYGGTDDPVLGPIYKAIANKARDLGVSEEAMQALSGEVKKDPGFVLDLDIESFRRVAAQVPRSRTKIAVVHHNPNHVPSDDRDNFDTIVNAGPLKAALLESGFDLVLHGHRHTFHCSVESHPAASFAANRCYFISADSFGCKEHAPFLEIQLTRDAAEPQATNVGIREFSYANPTGYGAGTVRCQVALGHSEAQVLADIIASGWQDPKSNPKLKDAIDVVLPKLQDIHARLTQWSGHTKWVEHFHFQLQTYRRLWATTLYDRLTILNPGYQRYLREQYRERLARLQRSQHKVLYFSPEVSRAIIRCQWKPAKELWSGYQIRQPTNSTPSSLEIARILILDSSSVDVAALANLAYDHALCAIPLFVIDKKYLKQDHEIDFAIGADLDGSPIKACAFDKKEGEVREQTRLDSYDLISIFEKMLSDPHLQTAQEFAGEGRMWTDPAQAQRMTDQYAATRKASPLLVDILNKHLPKLGDGGVDLCCGTGNYTAPFTQKFQKLWGIDISAEMLAKAKERVPGVEWIQGDAKNPILPERSCDAAWMISALHYFLGEEQPLLLREIYRILKPGGVFVADTEFTEQHLSLWIVDYFPSLRQRFQNRLFSQAQYRTWLSQAGFRDAAFETHEYPAEEGDAFLRIGQHKPEMYLDEAVQKSMPAFQVMDLPERKKGLERLRDEIATGEVRRVRDRYIAKAQLPGDLGIVIARK